MFRLLRRAINSASSPFQDLRRIRPHSLMMSAVEISTYNHLEIENKWQQFWEDNNCFKTPTRTAGRPKKYVLDMFPYPSGAGLHVGHPEGYTATDIMARYYRAKGFDVLHPMGWDSFGLPAEQHAVQTGTHPAVTTYENIENFKRQLKSLGFSYDWSKEIATTDDDYVRWTQWIFLKLFSSGLATQKEVSVNWCPALGTVLANEEVINGLSERGNHPVIRQPLRQWVLKITNYADKLEEGLKSLDWPEGTLTAQRQWIGRSEGVSIQFKIKECNEYSIDVFTTRPDTLLGATYIVLAPEHPLVSILTSKENTDEVADYLQASASKSDLERTSIGKDKGKTGVGLGSHVIHPITGEELPIYIADYVLAGYGSGAVMAVPAHDERDYEFANNFNLPIKRVVKSNNDDDLPMVQAGVMCNSMEFDGLTTDECKSAVTRKLKDSGLGNEKVMYKLRDWIFSRQRYWGEPIPIYFPVEIDSGDPRKGDDHEIKFDTPIPVAEEDLPLKLPELENFEPGDDPQGCLSRAVDWRYFQKDGKWFARETNTMPQWAGSCWYYLRFADTKNNESIFSEEASSWFPVDLYVGGQEHAVLHLLYARFWHKVLHDLGILDHPEPFVKLVHQGMILGADGEKMSKSKGNVINPDDVVRECGADALRLYEMFMGPLEAVKPWQTSQMTGVVRFRDRVYNMVKNGVSDDPLPNDALKEMHKTIKKVTNDIEILSFNTAISQMMVFSNVLRELGTKPNKDAVEILLILLAPFAPHVAEECWNMLGHDESISLQTWPTYDEELCTDSIVNVAVQVNGKLRGTLQIEKDTVQEDAMTLALEQSSVKKFTDGVDIIKVIYVPGKILNIVAKPRK